MKTISTHSNMSKSALQTLDVVSHENSSEPFSESGELRPRDATGSGKGRGFRRWGPLYLTAFLLIVVAYVLLIVSFFVYTFKKEMYIEAPQLHPKGATDPNTTVCVSGCSAMNASSVKELYDTMIQPVLGDSEYYYSYNPAWANWRRKTLQKAIDSVVDLSNYSCTPSGPSNYSITLGMTVDSMYMNYSVDCSAQYLQWYAYAGGEMLLSTTFFKAVGGPRLHGGDDDYYAVGTANIVLLFLFFFLSGLMLLSAMLKVCYSPGDGNDRCCGCNTTTVQRLLAAAISFQVIGVAMIIVVSFIVTAIRPKEKAVQTCSYKYVGSCFGVIAMKLQGGYIGLYVVLLVTQMVALALICAGYALKVAF